MLIDRDCVLLDGTCKCVQPWENCKYIVREDGTEGGQQAPLESPHPHGERHPNIRDDILS